MTVSQAVLLVGGRGTRMWPLTATVPKGLIPVAGLPFLDFQLRQLSAIGVEQVFLAVGGSQLDQWSAFAARRPGVELAIEDEPLDTAGPVRAILDSLEDRFLVLNGDVIVEADVAGFVAAAGDHSGTLALIEVEDTSAYGVVVLGEEGEVSRFVEKPPIAEAPARTVNAGMYVLRRDVLSHYPEGPLSFERTVFPDLVARGRLGGVVVQGRWLDIGTPELFLDCTGEALLGNTSLHRPGGPHLSEGDVLGETGGDWAWVATGASVASGAIVEDAVLLPGAKVGAGSVVRRAIIGWDASVGNDCVVTGDAIVGAGAVIGSGIELDHGVRIAPEARLGDGEVTFSPPK